MPSQTTPAASRLVSLDAYRGLVMVSLAANGFGLVKAAKEMPDCPWLTFLARQFDHVPWIGCVYWDLIQPSFMFMVGVSMAYSYVKRQAQGAAYASLLAHACWRALVLIFLGIFLISNNRDKTDWSFVNVLTQIGLGYPFLFLLWGRPARVQATVAGLVLALYWALFAVYPLPNDGFDGASVGLPADWKFLPGFLAHWEKNTNVAAAFDRWYLNLFRAEGDPFRFNAGGYATLNFIPSLVTMLFGLMAGELIRSGRRNADKFWILVGAGLAMLATGLVLHELWVCPIVKRIWTPTWTLYSTGWTLLFLAGFYGLGDVLPDYRWGRVGRWLLLPLVVVGMNSIAMYCMSMTLRGWTRGAIATHFGKDYAATAAEWGLAALYGRAEIPSGYVAAGAPIVEAVSVLCVLWLVCYAMYRQKIFLRI